MGHMLGFSFPENFNYPYISKSITEFWRRWHISLGTWFKEYVYIPLGGSRRGRAASVRNILIVWLLTGIWHGASLNFLFWGMYFGFLLLIEKFLPDSFTRRLPGTFRQAVTFLLVLFGWVLFAFEDMGEGAAYLAQMTGQAGLSLSNSRTVFLFKGNAVLLAACLIGSTPLPAAAASRLFRKLAGNGPSSGSAKSAGQQTVSACTRDVSGALRLLPAVLELLFLAVLFLLSTAYLVDATYNPFLYFRF